jgi:hypothetical protein
MKVTGTVRLNRASDGVNWWTIEVDGGDSFQAGNVVDLANLWAGLADERVEIEVNELPVPTPRVAT